MRLLPNALTLFRVFASPLLAWLIVESHFRKALALVVLAGLTDWFDGFTARWLKAGGKFGVVLDPMADKVLLVTLYLALAAAGEIKLWLLCLIMGRDLVIVIGALLLRIFRKVKDFRPTILGKVSTFFQIVFVLMVLLNAAFPNRFLLWLQVTAFVLTAIFTTLSGADYIRIGIRLTARRRLSAA